MQGNDAVKFGHEFIVGELPLRCSGKSVRNSFGDHLAANASGYLVVSTK